MTSLSARLTVLYAVSFLFLSAAMLAIGYRQIDQKMVHGLDTLLNTERQRVFNHLALGDPTSDPAALKAKLQRSSDNSAALFSVEIRNRNSATLFLSSNLSGRLPVPSAGWDFRTIYYPNGNGARVGRFDYGDLTAFIATPTSNVEDAMRGYIETSVGLLFVMAMISMTIGYALSQIALRPLREIAATAARIRPDNLNERIAVEKMGKELRNLAGLLNAMLDRIEASFNQIRQFTADASHELKTPLSLVRLQAETLLVDTKLSDVQENALVAQLDHIDRISTMVDDLLLLARADSNSMLLECASHDPKVFLTTLMSDAMVLAEASECVAWLDHSGVGTAQFDARWVRQIIFNLLTNALRASPPKSVVAIHSTLETDIWNISVIDQGGGITPDKRARMFDRFVTGVEGGTGLGLAICRSIVELHGGTIGAKSGPAGKGLAVYFSLPRSARQI